MLHVVLGIFLLLGHARSCPCTFSSELREVTCEPYSQDTLPFDLPDCLEPFVDRDEVERLVLKLQTFPRLIAGSFMFFPNILHLDISNCQIGSIDEFALDENGKLTTIILNSNRLSSIPSLFKNADNSLQSFTARHNDLQSIDFKYLGGLVVLNLVDNLLNDNEISSSLAYIQNLHELHLDSNLIESIDKKTFSHQKKLSLLTLWSNIISEIEPGSFDHLVKLQYLDIRQNPFIDYTTESWVFCHRLENKILQVPFNQYGIIVKDIKIDQYTNNYCETIDSAFYPDSAQDPCNDDDGHLTCNGKIEALVCKLKKLPFKSITFKFPKDTHYVDVENFYEAETNSYFKGINQVNGKSNMTKYLPHLDLFGTKFDLSSLDLFVGPRTETVNVFADTVYMSKAIKSPIFFQLNIQARIISISEDISMNMTHTQFFQSFASDQPVDNWATVEEVIDDVGDASFSVKKLGYVKLQQATTVHLRDPDQNICTPKIFNVEQYENEHNTSSSVFYNRAQINLLRMAVRTLASTRSNDQLAIAMADHTIKKTNNPDIVKDKKAYIVAQKLMRDKEILTNHQRRVPFYSINTIKDLAEVMYDRMSDYARSERDLMLKLDISLGRMADMNKNFEDAKRMRELYFELELQTLEQIWNATDSAWHWSFNASRNMEDSIQDSIQKNGEEMFEMKENDLREMLARARETVISDQAVVDKFRAEIERYSVEASLSLKYQRNQLKATNEQGETVEHEKLEFDRDIEEWKSKQILKAVFGFFKALVGIAVGMATENPAAAEAGVEAGAAEAGSAAKDIKKLMDVLVKLIEALSEMMDMLNDMSGVGDIDINIPDIDGDMAFESALKWRDALENASKMKNMTSSFADVKTFGETKIASVGPATDNEVDPSDLTQAMSMYADRGGELIQETVNFADMMMHLADLAGDLKVAETNLEIAIEQVGRIIEIQASLTYQHKGYVQWMNKHRDDYQDECDHFAEEYDNASAERKEEFKKKIIELFDKFKRAFEESNSQYFAQMNNLTTSLYAKVVTLKQHSMTQRSIMMNLYQDFCDGLFYVSFKSCDMNHNIPTMSEDFGVLLEKLNDLKWDAITSLEDFSGTIQEVEQVRFDLLDECYSGFNISQKFGPVRSLKEAHQVLFRPKDHTSYFDMDRFYRVRLDTIEIHLLDEDDKLIPSSQDSADGAFKFAVYFPLEFNDTNVDNEVFTFRTIRRQCSADYFTTNTGDIHQISNCKVDEEFEGVNHKVSHNGIFKIVVIEANQSLLNQVSKIQVNIGGSYVLRARESEDRDIQKEDKIFN